MSFYDKRIIPALNLLQSPVLLILRLFIGWQFFVTGLGKVRSIDHVIEFFTSLGIPAPALNAHFVAYLELIGGALLFVGLASRLIAVPLAVSMTTALLTADRAAVMNLFEDPDGLLMAAPTPFLAVSLIVAAFGPGVFSLDFLIRWWLKRRAPQA